jgi:hypothetical protein
MIPFTKKQGKLTDSLAVGGSWPPIPLISKSTVNRTDPSSFGIARNTFSADSEAISENWEELDDALRTNSKVWSLGIFAMRRPASSGLSAKRIGVSHEKRPDIEDKYDN